VFVKEYCSQLLLGFSLFLELQKILLHMSKVEHEKKRAAISVIIVLFEVIFFLLYVFSNCKSLFVLLIHCSNPLELSQPVKLSEVTVA